MVTGVRAFLREALLAGGMIGLLIIGLIAHTDSIPPLVVVESSSMSHDEMQGTLDAIDAGDLVMVMGTPDHRVITFAEATDPTHEAFGYEQHGMPGDVIIYRKDGSTTETPIIHRAILRAVANVTNDPIDRTEGRCMGDGSWDPISIGADGLRGTCVLTWDVPGTSLRNVSNVTWSFDGMGTGSYPCDHRMGPYHHGSTLDGNLTVRQWDPGHAGFLTLGDNNRCSFDQGYAANPSSVGLPTSTGVVGTIRSDWLVGTGGGAIPWFGAIKLVVAGGPLGASEVPDRSFVGLGVVIALMLVMPARVSTLVQSILAMGPEGRASTEEALMSASDQE